MKKRPWIADAAIGLVLTCAVAGSYLFLRESALERLELQAYDARLQFRANLDPSADIVLVAIDDDSIDRIGRWPWPRTRLAELLDILSAAGPRVIGLDIMLSESSRNPAIDELEEMKSRYLQLVSQKKILQKPGAQFEQEFSSAAVRLDTDTPLAAAIAAAANVVMPMDLADVGESMGERPPELPLAVSSSAVISKAVALPEGAADFSARKATPPLLPFVEAAAGLGHVWVMADQDGVVRRETPAIKYGEEVFPSFAVQLVARYLGLSSQDVQVAAGREVTVGKRKIPLDAEQAMLVTFNGPEKTFRYYSFHEVLAGKVPAEIFKDKIVIIGTAANGVGQPYATPVSPALPPIEYIANVVENILSGRYIVRPEWAFNAEIGGIAFIGLFIMFLLPRLRALGGVGVTLVLLAAMLGGGFYAFQERGEWVKVVYPSFLLLAGYMVIVTRRFFFTEQGKELVEASQVETNKMLGLSFQGQGMLDMSFEKFRLIPKDLIDDSFKETLYNLGLDFERKRQYGKAVSVYQHISGVDEKYKDIQTKIETLSKAAEGAVFGGLGKSSPEGTVIVTGGASKPTLGRYEIEKELGRGAMGIVYLGKDPKINRLVAIKTLMLGEGDSAAEVKEVKERFFREAESAGTLNHPGIVRVFDAGEEQDICYIAMELLDGQDLVKFTKKDGMLPVETAMDYVARVAEALDYAHQQGIVHRDIKPANIMLLKDGSVRVTDFGIARIQASSKTATGTVMGTPSYMSPEQVAGKKVDGRSDLFSLGVSLFEFLTGEKPFKGGEGIGTLLFQIANDPAPDPSAVNPAIGPRVKRIIDKSLAKKPEERYQRGSELAKDLRAAIEALKSGAPDSAPAPAPAPATAAIPSLEIPESSVPSFDPEATAASMELPAATVSEEPKIDWGETLSETPAVADAAASEPALDFGLGAETTSEATASFELPQEPSESGFSAQEIASTIDFGGLSLDAPIPEPTAVSLDPVQEEPALSMSETAAEPEPPASDETLVLSPGQMAGLWDVGAAEAELPPPADPGLDKASRLIDSIMPDLTLDPSLGLQAPDFDPKKNPPA